MRIYLTIISFLAFLSCQEDQLLEPAFYACTALANEDNHPRGSEFQQLAEDIVGEGAPGIMLSIKDHEGSWSGAFGKADLANNTDMEACHITRVGSTVKTFTAVTILMLQEENKLDLDDLAANYLSAKRIKELRNAKSATIRQLLQHTSGIYNYITNLKFQTASLNDLEKVWQPEELLDYARGQSANFSPDEDAQYSNTNYILLGDIIEAVEGKPFYEVFEERIFEPYGLAFTQFAAEDPVPDGIVRGYADLYSKKEVINATYYSGWDYYTADGGLISNAYDLRNFLDRLFSGEIISESALNEMTSWFAPRDQDSEGFETYYGLGIFKIETAYGPAYLHSGDAIGYFASMVHFPNQQVTISWAVNGNYGAIDEHTQSKEAMERIFDVVLSD